MGPQQTRPPNAMVVTDAVASSMSCHACGVVNVWEWLLCPTFPPKLTVTLMFLVMTWGKSATPLRASSLRTKAVPNMVPFLEKEIVLSSPSKS